MRKARVAKAPANILRRYQAASASRSCLTAPTRAVLNRLEAKFGRVRIVSTCRPGAVIAGSVRPSFHRYGMAVDFDAPRGRKAEVVRWLHRDEPVLVMTYRDMGHVHFNLGQRGIAPACNSRTRKHRYAAR